MEHAVAETGFDGWNYLSSTLIFKVQLLVEMICSNELRASLQEFEEALEVRF